MHIPVLLKEVVEILNPQSEEFFIDGTVGSGGHVIAISEKIGSKGKLLGLDWDEKAVESFKLKIKNLKPKTIVVHANYADLPEILKKHNLPKADGLILDLGFSSESLTANKGFSFLKSEPLDMRYDIKQGITVAEIINSFSEKDLAEIFWQYGEERYSRQIAKKIIQERKSENIKTTFDLVEVIKKAIPRNYERNRINPATRVFQALRIYVNQELKNLEKLLNNVNKIIKDKGRIAIISYHSLEDRLVKNRFRELKNQKKALILTKKPVRPTLKEIKENPRSRSAKLRAITLI